MHDDELDPDDELAELVADNELDEDEEEMSEQDFNAHTLSIRRADGEEVMTISTLLSGHQWSVYMEPGGAIHNAYIGTRHESPVWVDAIDGRIERAEDGTYVLRLP